MSLAALSVHDRKLMSAVKRNNVCLARNLLKNSKININCAEENGTTCLHIAIRQHNIRMVELLLAHKIEVNPDMSRFEVLEAPEVTPPLIEAILRSAQRELVKLLITAGADVNAKFKGIGPLRLTLFHKNFPLAELLLESGVDVPVSAEFDDSYVFTAMQVKCPASIFKRIIERVDSSELKRTNIFGLSYLNLAITSCENEEIMKILLDRPEIDPLKTTSDKWTILHSAAMSRKRKVESVRWLLDRGVDLNATTSAKSTPLHVALKRGNSIMAKMFIDLGADVNAKTSDGAFPLYLATRHCSPEIVKLLITKGANVHDKNFSGQTALHIRRDDKVYITDKLSENIRTLLLHGANPLAKDDNGYTVLQTLAEHHDHHLEAALEIVRWLTAFMLAEKKSIDDGDFKLILQKLEFEKVYSFGAREIDVMKITKVYEDVTLFHVFSISEDRLAKMMNNEEFLPSFLSVYLKDNFPMFEVYISAKLQRAEKKMRTYRALKQHLLDTHTPISHLPDVVLDHLIGYLTIEDLPEGHKHYMKNTFF